MNLRAKMTVQSVTKTTYSESPTLLAVYANGKPEDNSFAKSTPSGSLTLQIDNPDAQGILLPGKTFYIDISPAD